MPWNNVSHQCYISHVTFHFFPSIELLRLHFFHTRTVFCFALLLCFVLLCICRGCAYETLISYCLLFHFELPQRCSTLTKIKYQRKKTESVENERNEGNEKREREKERKGKVNRRIWEREKNRSKKTDALDTENLFFVWIQMKWITFVHVLIKSFLTCFIFYARFLYIICSFLLQIHCKSLVWCAVSNCLCAIQFLPELSSAAVECPFTF